MSPILSKSSVKNEQKVACKSPSLPQEPTHPFRIGGTVVDKILKKGKRPEEFAYGPPTTVVAITRTAVDSYYPDKAGGKG